MNIDTLTLVIYNIKSLTIFDSKFFTNIFTRRSIEFSCSNSFLIITVFRGNKMTWSFIILTDNIFYCYISFGSGLYTGGCIKNWITDLRNAYFVRSALIIINSCGSIIINTVSLYSMTNLCTCLNFPTIIKIFISNRRNAPCLHKRNRWIAPR